jgi:uncharacterized protein with NRDE domain
MCLLMLAWQAHPRYRLVVAANRDEYHARAAAPLGKWASPESILAGRDLKAQGTWLGVDRHRRFGVVTNFRELQRPRPDAPSRGELIPHYLGGTAGAEQFLGALAPGGEEYSGFNLLLTDEHSLWYGSNRATPFARPLGAGVYGLSNELLDTPWPKVTRVRAGFNAWLAAHPAAPIEDLFALLADRTQAPDASLPADAHLTLEWRRALSSPFVLHPDYGTRCSTVLLQEPLGRLHVIERRFDARGETTGQTEFELNRDEWP